MLGMRRPAFREYRSGSSRRDACTLFPVFSSSTSSQEDSRALDWSAPTGGSKALREQRFRAGHHYLATEERGTPVDHTLRILAAS
jgi:hypothetical protein